MIVIRLCVRPETQLVFSLVRYLFSLRFQACLYARRVLVVGVWLTVNIRKVSCSCGHVFITKRSKPRLTYGKEWYQKASNE